MSVNSNYHYPQTTALVRQTIAPVSGPKFSGPSSQVEQVQSDEQSAVSTPAPRSRFKTFLLGAGLVTGTVLVGRRVVPAIGKGVVSSWRKEGAARQSVGSVSGKLASMAATGGGYLLSALRSDVGMRLLVGGAGVLALHWPAFKIITEKVTQENLQKVLNPEFIESVHKEVAAHGLHSPQAVKEYIMQNKGSVAQQIATQTGFSQESVQETLSSLLSAMGSQAA